MNPAFWTKYILRSLQRSGRRTVFAAVCICVGVAGVVALQTASLTVQTALTSNVRAANGGDVSVISQTAPLSATDLAHFDQLKRRGEITAWTAVSSVHATAVGSHRQLVPFNVDIVQAPPWPLGGEPTFVSPSNGHVSALIRRPGDVLITSVLANELGVGVGSRLLVNSIGGHGLHASVQGILAETSFEHASVMTVQRSDAAILSDRMRHYNAVYVNVPGNPAAVAADLRNQFPVATVQTVNDALQSARLQVHDFRQFLLLVGLLALLIAGVGILNAMQSMLAWRRLEIAMLKTMGFRQGTLYALFGGEALALGLLGGVLGTVLGAAASKIITDALAKAMAINVQFQLDGSTLAGGIALGVVATLVFATLPIVRAAQFRPLEILRESSGTPSVRGWFGTLALLALILVLFAVLAAVTIGDTTIAVEFVVGAFAVCAILTGLFALVVLWIGKLGRPTSRVFGGAILFLLLAAFAVSALRVPAIAPILLLALLVWAATMFLPAQRLLTLLIPARSLSRRTGRTSVTLVAYLAGVLAMTVTLSVAVSLRGQINGALASAGSVNLVAITNVTGEPSVLRASRHLRGIDQMSATLFVPTKATAFNGIPLAQVIGPSPTGGDPGDNERGRLLGGFSGSRLAQNELPRGVQIVQGRSLRGADAGTSAVIVRNTLREQPYGLHLGDRITLQGTGNNVSKTVRIAGFYARPRGQRGFGSFFIAPILGDRSVAKSLGGPDTQSVISYHVNAQQLTLDATSIQRSVPGALVVDIGDLSAVVENILNELLNLLAVITALVLGAGVAVVANGVALAMFERRREVAIYKAIGFGPRSVLRFILVENSLLGTIAGATSVLGTALALGVLSRLALQRAVGFDPLLAIWVLLAAALLALATAYLAARKPVGLRPLEALRNE